MTRTTIGIAGYVALLIGAALVAATLGAAAERVLVVFFISLIAVLGIGLYSGNSGILSFGHLGFMAIGAYASGILTMPVAMKQVSLANIPDFLGTAEMGLAGATVVAVALAMAVALVVGIVIARLEGSAATIATLGLLVIVHGIMVGARDYTRGSQSFFGVPRLTDIWVAAGCAVLAIVLARIFRDSVPGLKLRAARDDALAAGAMGVNVRLNRLGAWVLSAGIVALAGVLYGHFLGTFSPKAFYFVDTFPLLAMLIVGGIGTVTGALTGAVLITVLTELLRRAEAVKEIAGFELPQLFGLTKIGVGLVILFVLWKRAAGLIDRLEWDEMLFPRRRAEKGGALPEVRAEGAELRGEEITKAFDGLLAVDGVTLSVREGEIVGLIGPNGSGKTTLLNVLSGVLPATKGRVLIGGEDVTGRPARHLAGLGIGRTFQNIRLFASLSVRQNVAIAALRDWPAKTGADERTDAALAAMGLTEKAGLQASTLSYGDQRRVEIARALALSPRFLFLDEPAAGMNREETDALMADLKSLRDATGMGVLIVDHDLPLIMRLCERVAVMNEGRVIAEGAPAEVQKHPAVIEAYLGRKGSRQVAEALETTG